MEHLLSYLSLLLLPITHELGHFMTALIFGKRIKFRFRLERIFGIPVPRWTWVMPIMSKWKQRLVAQAGFVTEFSLALILPEVYFIGSLIHFTAYPWYAGKYNDFTSMVS